jgi:hypothetical protein
MESALLFTSLKWLRQLFSRVKPHTEWNVSGLF